MRRFLHALYTLAVVFVTLWPRPYVDTYVAQPIQQQHTMIHVVCFAGLAAASLWAYGRKDRRWDSRWKVWVCCVLFGALLEALQHLVPDINRHGNLRDVLENTWGSSAGIWLPGIFWPRKTPKKDVSP